jgi:hypothetical protein
MTAITSRSVPKAQVEPGILVQLPSFCRHLSAQNMAPGRSRPTARPPSASTSS